MKMKLLTYILCCMPFAANAAIPYSVEQIGTSEQSVVTDKNDSEAFARHRRFYVGGAYNYSMWQDGSDAAVLVKGKDTSSFEAMAGIRVYDTFRLEANYIKTDAEYDAFSLSGNVAMVNALFDARIDSIYRLFRKQRLVPYVGFGAGVAWNSADGVDIDNKMTPVAAALAGLGIELGDRFALDVGYRYMYMFTPKFSVIENFAPVAHQFRAGVRVNF